MELGRKNIIACKRACKAAAIVGLGCAMCALLHQRIKAVHKVVEAAVGNACPQRMGLAAMLSLVHLVPAHLRHLEAAAIGLCLARQIELAHITGDQPQARNITFVAVIQQHLHAHAHAKQRLVGGGMQHGFLQAGLTQLAHAVGHGTLARQDHAMGSQHDFRIGRHDHVPAGIGCSRAHGLRDRTQIAHAVIDHGHGVVLQTHSIYRLLRLHFSIETI